MEAMEAAQRLVEHRHPTAVVAILAGSSARGEATATSDLDLVLVLEGSGRSFRETLREHGQLVEVFAYTRDELRRWWDVDASAGSCVLAHMCATGLLLRGGEQGRRLQEQARAFLAAGPPSLPYDELATRRYRLTGSLDDLRDATDQAEQQVIAATVLLNVADLCLIARRQWRGQGKWLARQLRATAPELAGRLLIAHREATAAGQIDDLAQIGEEVLREVGGPLAEGFRRG